MSSLALAAEARYIAGMHVFVFQSRTKEKLLAFAARSDGGNLPNQSGPWKLLGHTSLPDGDPVNALILAANIVAEGIYRDGLYLFETEAHLKHLPQAGHA